VQHAVASSDGDTRLLRDGIAAGGGAGRLDTAATAFVRDWLLGLLKTRRQHLDEGAPEQAGGGSEYVALLEGAGTVALAMGKQEAAWLADAEVSFRAALERLGTSDLPRSAKAQTLLAQVCVCCVCVCVCVCVCAHLTPPLTFHGLPRSRPAAKSQGEEANGRGKKPRDKEAWRPD
jgi:hypothetical protein